MPENSIESCFSDERINVKAQFPDYSITEIAKEIGRRWACLDPATKMSYEQRYAESRKKGYNSQKSFWA